MDYIRHDGRLFDELRQVKVTCGYTEMAAGSVLIECGKTRVLCTASIEEGVPPFLKGTGKGWVTAEYSMLPGSTPQRKRRDSLKPDGRSVEIQRLIGRSLRSVCNMAALGERTIYLDCDVIQADGGTRTASITGAFVALVLACKKLMDDKKIFDSPIGGQVAAVSVGVVAQSPMLDLCYVEDSKAQVDMNLVLTGSGEFIELQGTGEGRPFTRAEHDKLLELGEKGIMELMQLQRNALGDAAILIGMPAKLVLASNNQKKLNEIKGLLGSRFEVVTLKEIGLDIDVVEDGKTFEENAIKKAETIRKITNCATLADDSGLEVDALGGNPGVNSARFAGIHGDDDANNRKLLEELRDVPAPRTARFVSVLALVRPGKTNLVVRGTCDGEIIHELRGEYDFGYDPLFLYPPLNRTFAELGLEAKSKFSHRANAMGLLLTALDHENG